MAEPDRTEQGRRLADSLRRAAEIAESDGDHEIRSGPRVLPRESWGFKDGVEAQRHLRENVCPSGENPYGPYIPPADRGVSLTPKDELVRFPPHLQAMFSLITPQMSKAFIAFLQALVERAAVRKWWRRAWKLAAGVVVAAFATARWGVDQIPLLRDLANILKGHGS